MTTRFYAVLVALLCWLDAAFTAGAAVTFGNADHGITAGHGQLFMYNTNNGNGQWTEGALRWKLEPAS